MEANYINKNVTCHTEWCASLTIVPKKDNSLRLCLDPHALNKSLQRTHHKISTLEELNLIFVNAKYFSILMLRVVTGVSNLQNIFNYWQLSTLLLGNTVFTIWSESYICLLWMDGIKRIINICKVKCVYPVT